MQITAVLLAAGGNIEDFSRNGSDPREIMIKVSGISAETLQSAIASFDSGSEFSLADGA